MSIRRNFTVDELTPLKDAGPVAVSARAQVASADKIIDLGEGFVEGNIVLDISAIEGDSNDEIFDVVAQLSSDNDFSDKNTVIERCSMTFCCKEVARTDGTVDGVAGRFILPFDNEFGGTIYRYLSLYTVVAGTIVTGINYTARLAKRNAG